MWQKLIRLDAFELEKARVQLLNALQLVSAVPCSYLDDKTPQAYLNWNNEDNCIECCEIEKLNPLKISLDIQQFVLSMIGANDHSEHLVLSGITYPMAFGWMKIKLDKFDLESDIYDDSTDYTLERILEADEELNVTNQQIFNDLVIHFKNAFSLFSELKESYNIHNSIYIDPSNLSMNLPLFADEKTSRMKFAPGDKNYLEPYFAIDITNEESSALKNTIPASGFWNNKDWSGMVLLTGDYLNLDPEVEKSKVRDFLNDNYKKIVKK